MCIRDSFVWLQIITAAYVAFAHGANDRSNAIGPMAAVWQVLSNDTGMLMEKAPIPLWLVLLGSAGIAVGVLTWGWRVMETIGKKITEITPTRGFAAEFGAATTIMIFSMPFLAVPVSTTLTLVGAVVGVGLAGGYFADGSFPEAEAAARCCAEALAGAGHSLHEVNLKHVEQSRAAAFLITNFESAQLHFKRLQTQADDFDQDTVSKITGKDSPRINEFES